MSLLLSDWSSKTSTEVCAGSRIALVADEIKLMSVLDPVLPLVAHDINVLIEVP